MKNKNYLFLTSLALILSCSGVKFINNSTTEIINYGVISSKATKINNDFDEKSVTGNTVIQNGLRIIEKTDTVEGKIGLIFGVNFVINNPETKMIPVKRVWTLPKETTMLNGKSIKSITRNDFIKTNISEWMYYTIENESEIIKGKWTIQYFYKNKEILKKDFFMK